MTGKWTALSVFGVFALLALTDADFHQEDTKFTLTPEAGFSMKEYTHKSPFILAIFHQEQEEITKDWTVQDVDKRRGGRVIRAEVAIKLKGRRPKPEGEEVVMMPGRLGEVRQCHFLVLDAGRYLSCC